MAKNLYPLPQKNTEHAYDKYLPKLSNTDIRGNLLFIPFLPGYMVSPSNETRLSVQSICY